MSGYDFGIVTNFLVGTASLFLKGEDEKKKRRGRIRQIKSKKGPNSCRFRRISIIFQFVVTAKSEFGINFLVC